MRLQRAKKEISLKIDWIDFSKKAAKNIVDLAIPIIMGLICYYLFLHIGLHYETNDDAAALFMLAAEGEDFTMIFSKPLSIFISDLMSASPDVPIWAFMTLITITASLTICLFVLKKRLRLILFLPVSLFVVFFFTVTTVVQINFTRTAAAAAVAGVMLILQGILTFSQRGIAAKISSIIEVMLGVTVWFWGAMIRDLMAYLIIPFAGLFVVFYALSRTDKLSIKQFFKNLKTPIIISAAALAAAVVVTVISYNMYTPEENDALQHYKARISVQDYADNYPAYEEAEDEYRALGITENEYYMIFEGWTTEDTNVFTTELYTEMRETLYTENSFSDGLDTAIEYLETEYEIWIFAFVFIVVLSVFLKGMRKAYLPIFIICAFAYLIFLAIQGRVLPRAVDPVVLYIVLLSSLFFGTKSEGSDESSIVVKPKIASIVLSATLLFLTVPVVGVIFSDFSENLEKAKEEYFGQTYPQIAYDFYDYIDQNNETAYLLTINDGISFMPATNKPIFVPADPKIAENLFFLGGWDARSPANYERLAKFGIDNPLEDLVTKQNTLTVYSESLHSYLSYHYGDEITVSLVETAIFSDNARMDFVMFTKPLGEIIQPIDEDREEGVAVDVSQFFYAELSEGYVNVPTHDTLCIRGKLNEEQIEQYKELYLNIETQLGRESYGIFIEADGSFECYAFGPDIDILDESYEISLVARDDSGDLITTNIFTEFFMN